MTRIIDEDITAVNRTMAARTPHQTWAPIVAGNDWAWFTALDPEWDLFYLEPVAWREAGIATRLRKAFGAIHRPGLGIAVTTKVLHIKRPMLVPVLDSLVIAQIGGRVDDVPATWVAAVEHIRAVGRANLPQLRLIRDHLHRVGLPDRTHLRVLDALLWTSSPGSNLLSSLDGWERVVRLGGPSGRDGRLRSSDTALRPCPRRGSRSGSPGSSRRANAGCSSRGKCWLLVTGERKASILRRALEAPEGPDCPASYLRRHARLRIIVDEPAAAELRPSPGLTTPEAADPGAGPRALTPAPRIGPCAAVGGCMRGAVGVVPARGATHRPQGQPAGSQPPSDGRNRGPWANTPLPRVAAPCREPPSPAPVQGPCRELCVAGPRREPRVAGPRREPCAAGPDRHGRGSARRGEHHLRHPGRRARPNPAGQRLA